MTADTLTLTSFLLARIAEDRAFVQRGRDHVDPDDAVWPTAAARVLAECEAKEEIVNLYGVTDDRSIPVEAWVVMRGAARALAAVYSDHPDFRPEWKP